jgi:hypothetical protein
MTDRMNEQKVQSYIVKIWIEETICERGKGAWRGYITHVSSGERHYVKSIDEITNFFQQHLALMM